jgi:hypothetical protein
MEHYTNRQALPSLTFNARSEVALSVKGNDVEQGCSWGVVNIVPC